MTIEETIARERQKAKEQRIYISYISTTWNKEYSKKCEVYAKEHEQLAEWLEELKELRELKDTITSNAEVLERQGYNKAIDDFAERLKEMANNSSTKYIRLSDKETITTYGVEQIAEQLKAGEQDK